MKKKQLGQALLSNKRTRLGGQTKTSTVVYMDWPITHKTPQTTAFECFYGRQNPQRMTDGVA